MHVRRAGPEDADACAAVMAAVAQEGRWILTEAPVDVAGWALSMQARNDPVWVVEEPGPPARIFGHLGLHQAHPKAPDVLELGMGVLSEVRGRGAGSALLSAALEYARESGAHRVELAVFPENARAIGLYAKHGFAVEGLQRERWPRRDGTRRDSLLMALILR
jgi:RimJ/RimL family protein N-acetyltransferase